MRIELLHQILLHAPVHLFWRLAGLNRMLNSLLLMESFWKEKVRRTFARIQQGIPCYRAYYLLSIVSKTGDLYKIGSSEPLEKDISMVVFPIKDDPTVRFVSHRVGQNYHLELVSHDRRELICTDLLLLNRLYLNGIPSNQPKGTTSYLRYLLKGKSGVHLMEFYQKGDHHLYRLSPLPPLLAIHPNFIIGYNLVGSNFLLLSNGQLIRELNGVETTVSTKVNDCYRHGPFLIVLMNDGSVVRIAEDLTQLHLGGPYIKIHSGGQAAFILCYSLNGTIDRYSYNTWTLFDTIKLSKSLKMITSFNAELLVVATDGTSYIYDPNNRSLLRPSQLCYDEVGYISKDFIIANRYHPPTNML